MVVTVSVILYKQLGFSNAQIAFSTSWLYLPWVLKPLWSPVVDLLKTRRLWIWTTELLFGAGMAGIALTLPTTRAFQLSLAFFWLLAFSSATHDIAADGFYMLALPEREQSFFIGVRNFFYRVAMISAQGLLVMAAGEIQQRTGSKVLGWSLACGIGSALFLALGAYHGFMLPRPVSDHRGPSRSLNQLFEQFFRTFGEFFRKPKIILLLAFILFYRFGEAQLLKIIAPFLLDSRSTGGLGLDVKQVGFVYGTIGVIALMLGGILGGILVSRWGLRAWLWPMVCVMHVPDLSFVFLAWIQPHNLGVISGCVAAEQFGYGFGLTAYFLYLIHIARGNHPTAHYAICTGFIALGMMMPGLWSGWLQERIGYLHFFGWVLVATIPGFVLTGLISFEPDFGRKSA